VECGVCSKESFVYIMRITFARRKQVCACAHKIMKRVHCVSFPVHAGPSAWSTKGRQPSGAVLHSSRDSQRQMAVDLWTKPSVISTLGWL